MGFAGEVRRADQEIRDGVLIPSAGRVGLEWSFSKNVTARFTGSTVNSRPSSRERELGIEATDFPGSQLPSSRRKPGLDGG